MFKEIIKAVKKLTKTPVAIDPAGFNDPVALTTGWSPAKGGGASFCTHKLVQLVPHKVEFRATFGAKLFAAVFLLLGLGAMAVGVYGPTTGEERLFSMATILPSLVGLVFAGVGGILIYFLIRPIIFDRNIGKFYKGRKSPQEIFNQYGTYQKSNAVPLDQIHALQLIAERCTSKNNSYYSYELNLVLQDGQRVNVIDHDKLDQICRDAATLAEFLGKPLWNAT